MIDFLGNRIQINDQIVVGADLEFYGGIVTDIGLDEDNKSAVKIKFDDADVSEWWLPKQVIVIKDYMRGDKRIERLNNVEEGIQVS
jgi:hypothetical protein